MTQRTRPLEILLVEDNAGDIELTVDAFGESSIPNRVHVVHDGIGAINFLRQEGTYAGAVVPDVILLDLNMPRMDGKEVLEIVKNDPELKAIPVIILSSSQAESDIARSYELHANCYIKKPDDLQNFLDMVKAVEDFWLSIVKLPRKTREQAA